jgi:hypothetical protein
VNAGKQGDECRILGSEVSGIRQPQMGSRLSYRITSVDDGDESEEQKGGVQALSKEFRGMLREG